MDMHICGEYNAYVNSISSVGQISKSPLILPTSTLQREKAKERLVAPHGERTTAKPSKTRPNRPINSPRHPLPPFQIRIQGCFLIPHRSAPTGKPPPLRAEVLPVEVGGPAGGPNGGLQRPLLGWISSGEQRRRRLRGVAAEAGTSASSAGEEAPPGGAGRGGTGGLRQGRKALAMRGPRPTTSSTSADPGSDDDAVNEVAGRPRTRASSRGGGATPR